MCNYAYNKLYELETFDEQAQSLVKKHVDEFKPDIFEIS